MKYCSVCKQAFEVIHSCSKCKCIRYCSKECQGKDWAYHKHYCASFSKFWMNQHDKFENLGEPLSSKMLEFLLTTNENANKVKQQHPDKVLVVSGCVDGFDGFGYDIKCLDECMNLFNETELTKIHGVPQLVDQNLLLVVYKLHVDAEAYELLHVLTVE